MIRLLDKGYWYAIISAVLLSSGVIVNKYLLDFVNPQMLAFAWFGMIFITSGVVLILTRGKKFFRTLRHHWKDGIVVGGLNAVAATFWFWALSLLDASTTSFLSRFSTIFIIILGVFFMKEKLGFFDVLGMAAAVIGALIINYSNGEYTTLGLLVALLAALGIAFHQVAAKIFVKRVEASFLVNLRALYTALFLFVFALLTGSIEAIPLGAWPGLVFGAGLLAALGFVFFYKALELTDVSKVAVIRTLDPFVVLLYSLILFRSAPNMQQIAGGTLIVAGVIIIISKHRLKEIVVAFRSLPWFG